MAGCSAPTESPEYCGRRNGWWGWAWAGLQTRLGDPRYSGTERKYPSDRPDRSNWLSSTYPQSHRNNIFAVQAPEFRWWRKRWSFPKGTHFPVVLSNLRGAGRRGRTGWLPIYCTKRALPKPLRKERRFSRDIGSRNRCFALELRTALREGRTRRTERPMIFSY